MIHTKTNCCQVEIQQPFATAPNMLTNIDVMVNLTRINRITD
jgi:hypothetical protein